MKLAFIGGGVMAEAILTGVLRDGVSSPSEVTVADVIAARLDDLRERHGVAVTGDNAEAVGGADLVILAVKPQNVPEVLDGLKGAVGDTQTVLSIIAGATIGTIANRLNHQSIVRAMPNTPGQLGEGVTVWTATESVDAEARALAGGVLAAMGKQVYVPNEKLIDVATGLSGSGPAYVFLFIEALIDAGVYLGMSRDMAREVVAQTVLGSAKMLDGSALSPSALREQVTSPGGTTAEGLLAMEEGGFRAAVMNGVIASYEKSAALGQGK